MASSDSELSLFRLGYDILVDIFKYYFSYDEKLKLYSMPEFYDLLSDSACWLVPYNLFDGFLQVIYVVKEGCFLNRDNYVFHVTIDEKKATLCKRYFTYSPKNSYVSSSSLRDLISNPLEQFEEVWTQEWDLEGFLDIYETFQEFYTHIDIDDVENLQWYNLYRKRIVIVDPRSNILRYPGIKAKIYDNFHIGKKVLIDDFENHQTAISRTTEYEITETCLHDFGRFTCFHREKEESYLPTIGYWKEIRREVYYLELDPMSDEETCNNSLESDSMSDEETCNNSLESDSMSDEETCNNSYDDEYRIVLKFFEPVKK